MGKSSKTAAAFRTSSKMASEAKLPTLDLVEGFHILEEYWRGELQSR